MVIKLTAQLILEAAILPTIRFLIWYLPFIGGVIAANMLTIKYFVANMISNQADQLPGFLEWYIPLLLVASFCFGVMATKVKNIHPVVMFFMFLFSLLTMRMGVVDMQVAYYNGYTQMMFSMLAASVFAVVTIYCLALMLQRVWVKALSRRKH